jgi:hypothetical protein
MITPGAAKKPSNHIPSVNFSTTCPTCRVSKYQLESFQKTPKLLYNSNDYGQQLHNAVLSKVSVQSFCCICRSNGKTPSWIQLQYSQFFSFKIIIFAASIQDIAVSKSEIVNWGFLNHSGLKLPENECSGTGLFSFQFFDVVGLVIIQKQT